VKLCAYFSTADFYKQTNKQKIKNKGKEIWEMCTVMIEMCEVKYSLNKAVLFSSESGD